MQLLQMSADEEISPQDDAEPIGVSQPFATRLFDKDRIPNRRADTHRRAVLEELAAEGQRLGLGY